MSTYGGFGGQGGGPLPSSTPTEENALYGVPSSTFVMLTKFTGVFTLVMMALSFIFCLAFGKADGTDYLLATNIIISCLIGVAIVWWHRNGDLAGNKLWFLILVFGVIIFQCITTDIYVFHARTIPPTPAPPLSSLKPITTATVRIVDNLVQ